MYYPCSENKGRFKKKRKCTIRVAKTKALISFAVTAKLICVFVFAYADCWFSHEEAQPYEPRREIIGLQGFRQGQTQMGTYNYSRGLEA